MPQAAAIWSLPRAFEFVKTMQDEGLVRGERPRGLGCGRTVFLGGWRAWFRGRSSAG